jgi:hypothetical protein
VVPTKGVFAEVKPSQEGSEVTAIRGTASGLCGRQESDPGGVAHVGTRGLQINCLVKHLVHDRLLAGPGALETGATLIGLLTILLLKLALLVCQRNFTVHVQGCLKSWAKNVTPQGDC